MKTRNSLLSLVLLMAVLLTACGGAAAPDSMMENSHEDAIAEPTHDTMMDEPVSTPEAMMNETTDMMETPSWFASPLTDARTGQTFRIN